MASCSVKAVCISQPAVVVFSATASSDELRAILTSAAPPPPSCAGVRPLVDLAAQRLHLTLDALHTLPELGFAEVVTTDACLADAFEFDNAAVINVAARTKVVLVRSASGGTWQRAGVEACGPDEALLPPLLTDDDVLDALTRPLLPASDLPLTWQWASLVVLGDAAAAPSAAASPAQAQQQPASTAQHAAVADTTTARRDLHPRTGHSGGAMPTASSEPVTARSVASSVAPTSSPAAAAPLHNEAHLAATGHHSAAALARSASFTSNRALRTPLCGRVNLLRPSAGPVLLASRQQRAEGGAMVAQDCGSKAAERRVGVTPTSLMAHMRGVAGRFLAGHALPLVSH